MFEQFRNPGSNTFNGVKAMAAWSGLTEAEVAWTAARIKELIAAGKSRQEAVAIVRAEGKTKPWESA